MSDPRTPNRLAREKSPYLLQHAHNPVDWYPWGDEAFARARAEDKPIFLSIGYSTCHWCHVMERESFESPEVAALMNAHFVCVKVDREERPDVDQVYMTALHAMGQGGGWPLTAILTPSLKPFWGGTYFAPRARAGRAGLMELIPRLSEAWHSERVAIESAGDQVMAALQSLGDVKHDARPVQELSDAVAVFLERSFDGECGGFGNEPRFPSPANLHFLWRRWARGARGAETARRMALAQLEAMRANGLHDHLGGGFHRYATDREWRIPHFEKMLYDQALLADAYLEAYAATGEARWADTARGVFEYVARDLTSPEGAFYSAEDADSEGEEGRFYAWTPAQLAGVLGAADADLFAFHYGVDAHGNFEHGTTVLHEAHEVADDVTAARLASMRARLLAARSQRVRPHRDDKVVTAWNGLFIHALAHGARVLREPALAERAMRAADFIWDHVRAADGTLLRRWRDGEAAGAGQLDDHAYYAHGCLELYAATHEPRWLERAVEVVGTWLAHFHDDTLGGCFDAPAGAEPGLGPDGLPRLKSTYDGAEWAGDSIASELLWRLGTLLDRAEWREQAEDAFAYHARRLATAPWAMPRMIAGMDLAAAGARHVVIVGERGMPATRALLDVLPARFRPDVECVLVDEAARPILERVVPFAAALPLRDGRPTGYVCVQYACRQPVHEPQALAAELGDTE